MTDDDIRRLRELAERARKPQGWKRIAFQAARLDEFREAASPDVVIRLLDELDRLRHENHNLNWALDTDGYEQMYTEAERVEHADAVARITEHLDRLAARKARLDALVPAGVDILDHIDALRRERDEAVHKLAATTEVRDDAVRLATKAADERDAAMAKIAAHNAECKSLCQRDTKGGRCEAYVSRGRECTDCPRNWMIDDSRTLLGGGGEAP